MKIVITGARGFIGANLVKALNKLGYEHLLLSDELDNDYKNENLSNSKYDLLVDRKLLFESLETYHPDFVFHIGARTDTAETNKEIFDQLNVSYSKRIWEYCTTNQIPLIYASSAATYGDGSLGFSDQEPIEPLKPLNAYGWSKQNFDLWTAKQENTPPFWAGLKFFNVYGPGETHKGRMASVVYHAYHQLTKNDALKLFRSHNRKYSDGAQLRDFIHVNDIVSICLFLFKNEGVSGLYNCGTGEAKTFNELAKYIFEAMEKPINIEYIDIPRDIRENYQYYTEATMRKLREAGYSKEFISLESGIKDYIINFLMTSKNKVV